MTPLRGLQSVYRKKICKGGLEWCLTLNKFKGVSFTRKPVNTDTKETCYSVRTIRLPVLRPIKRAVKIGKTSRLQAV